MISNLETELKKIFDENKDKRICVVGTTCTGKTALINKLNIGCDMDELIFPLLSKEERDYVCGDPWTREIGETMDRLVRERVVITPGIPLFGTVLLDADLIVYLHISDDLLKVRCEKRKANFINAKGMQAKIEEEIKTLNIKVITLEV